MATYVMKYGGTSVGSLEKIHAIAETLIARRRQGDDLVVVVSAMGDTTDRLIAMASELSPHPDKRDLDLLMSTGEQTTIALLSIAIKALGGKAVSLTGFQAGIETDQSHTRARIHQMKTDRIEKHLTDGEIVVVAGFQGISSQGDITTLGRGGSDTTAVGLAAVLGATCEIYTDVDGVYTVDPRLYPEAKKLEVISYEEMLEMASRGARILETRAVEMAHKYKVPLYVALSGGDYPGTYIKELDQQMEHKVVTGMTVDENCLMATLSGIPFSSQHIARIFAELASEQVLVDMISQTAPHEGKVTLSFTATKDDLMAVKAVTAKLKEEDPFTAMSVDLDDDVIKLSVVGIGMVSQTGVAASLFDIFSTNHIDFYQVTTSEISISYTIRSADADKAVRLVAYKFDL